jgi:hypothetical protein
MRSCLIGFAPEISGLKPFYETGERRGNDIFSQFMLIIFT